MKESLNTPDQSYLSERQRLIKQLVIDRARNNAEKWMEGYLRFFEPLFTRNSYTSENAYRFLCSEYKKILEEEYNQPRVFPNVDKPEEELIGDVDLVYLQSIAAEEDLTDFLNYTPEGGLLLAELTKAMHIANRLDYLSELLQQEEFLPFESHPAKIRTQKTREPKIPKQVTKAPKLDAQTVLWKDVMQTEELAGKVLKLLQEKGYIKSFEGNYSWTDIEKRPQQVVVALVTLLHNKGYFTQGLGKIHAAATVNQFRLKYDLKNFSSENQLKAFAKFGKEFYFIPEANRL